jgi:hypothetical protein
MTRNSKQVIIQNLHVEFLLHFMLHDGHVVFVTVKEKNENLLFNKPGILNDSVKYENGLDCFWAKKVVMIYKSDVDVMLVH